MKKLLFFLLLGGFMFSCSNEETFDQEVNQLPETVQKSKQITYNEFVSMYEKANLNKSDLAYLDENKIVKIIDLGELGNDVEQLLRENGIVSDSIIKNKLLKSGLPGRAIYVEAEEKFSENRLDYEYNSNVEMVMITTDAAKHANINSGFYSVQEVRVHHKFWTSNLRHSYVMLDSPECGYIYAQWGLGTVKDKERGYIVRPFGSGVGDMDMSASFVHVQKSKSGGNVNKWIPCHPTEAIWRYGYIFVFPPAYM